MRSCLICDDHALVREALVGAVTARWPEATIEQAATFPEAWEMVASEPDLCLADLAMPGADERAGIAGLRRRAPNTPVLVITGSHDDALLLDLIVGGVAGFAPKTSGTDILLAAIELVLAGGRYLPPRLAELVGGGVTMSPRQGEVATPVLTLRQTQVLRLVAKGCTNKEIARLLGLSPATIKTHVAQVLATIGTANRTEAAIRATTLGVI